MEIVIIVALILGMWGMFCVPLVYWARKPIKVKLWYWKNKGKGAKVVDYFTSDGDHDVFTVVPDENGAYKVNNKIHNIGEDTVKWSRFYDGRMVVNQDTSTSSFDPITKKVPIVPPELIEAAMRKIQIAEQRKAQMYQKLKDKDWMIPATLLAAALAAIVGWLALQGQEDVITACGTAKAVVQAAAPVVHAVINGTAVL